MEANPVTNLWAIGHVAQNAGARVQEIERVADAMGFQPMFWINGVPFFNMTQAVLMTEALENERKAQQQAVAASRN